MRVWLAVLALGCGRGSGTDEVPWSEKPTTGTETNPGGGVGGGGTKPTGVDCADVDDDQDGHDLCSDCDDAAADRFPGAAERCDGLDDDCDGAPLDGEVDGDGDGELDCATCDAAGFWLPTRGLAGDALDAEIEALIDPQWCADYSAATEFMFVVLDKDAATQDVECVYTGRRTAVGLDKPDATDMNTEHTWPQSLGAEEIPAKCDLHHLYPTDSDANSIRGNLPFGEVTGSVDWEEGGSKLGDGAGGTVFEPRDVHKGNVARSMLYFAHQYGYTLSSSELALYKAWHAEDPVDAAERARTLAIADQQDVANPFVACPELVDAL